MQKLRDPDRRSFLARVLGGSLLVGAGLILGAEAIAERRGRPSRRMVVDRDPRDPARPPPATAYARPQQATPPGPPPLPGTDAAPIPAPASRQRFVICPGHRRCPRR